MKLLKVHTVAAPVTALSAQAVIFSEGEGGPKDPCDRRKKF